MKDVAVTVSTRKNSPMEEPQHIPTEHDGKNGTQNPNPKTQT